MSYYIDNPNYKLKYGPVTVGPASGAVVALDVALALDTPADRATVVFARPGGALPNLAEPLTVEMGYVGGDLIRVFTGKVTEVRPDVRGTRVTALSPFTRLLTLRLAQTYLDRMAGQIVADLAGKAGIELGRVEDGASYPAYVADGRVDAYRHLRTLAEHTGFAVYCAPDGRLMFHAVGRSAPRHELTYGADLLSLEVRAGATPPGRVEVFGESPTDTAGVAAFAWLRKRAAPAAVGSGAVAVIIDSSIRTGAAAGLAARSASRRLRQQAVAGRLRALGRPEVALGHTVRIGGTPDPRLDGDFQVRCVRHTIERRSGFTTEIVLRGTGEDAP